MRTDCRWRVGAKSILQPVDGRSRATLSQIRHLEKNGKKKDPMKKKPQRRTAQIGAGGVLGFGPDRMDFGLRFRVWEVKNTLDFGFRA